MPGHHDRSLYPDAEELPGLVIFRFDAPLFFANARTFRDQIRRLAGTRAAAAVDRRSRPSRSPTSTRRRPTCWPTSTRSSTPPARRWCSPSSRTRCATKLERYELIGPLDPDHFFPTLDGALDAFREQTGADWTPPTKPGEGPGGSG